MSENVELLSTRDFLDDKNLAADDKKCFVLSSKHIKSHLVAFDNVSFSKFVSFSLDIAF